MGGRLNVISVEVDYRTYCPTNIHREDATEIDCVRLKWNGADTLAENIGLRRA